LDRGCCEEGVDVRGEGEGKAVKVFGWWCGWLDVMVLLREWGGGRSRASSEEEVDQGLEEHGGEVIE